MNHFPDDSDGLPSTQHYLLDRNKLEPFDIILSTTDDKTSKAIRKVTRGEYSHVNRRANMTHLSR